MGYVYRWDVKTRAWSVGYYTPHGQYPYNWEEESAHKTRTKAALRVRWLNGGDV